MLEEDVSLHEEKLNEIDLIQTQIISTEFKTTQEYELLRKSLTRSIKEVNWFWEVIIPTRYHFVFIFQESDKLYEIYSTTLEVISTSSSEPDDFAESDAHRLHLLRRTQQELDQIYSTTESIMSSAPSTRVSACRDSQALFLASTEPMLRNSVMISVAGEENDSGVHDTLSKNDSLLSSSQQNDSAYPEDSSEDSTDRSIYSPVKLRHPKVHVMSICLQFCFHTISFVYFFPAWPKTSDKIPPNYQSRSESQKSHWVFRSSNWIMYTNPVIFSKLQRLPSQMDQWKTQKSLEQKIFCIRPKEKTTILFY